MTNSRICVAFAPWRNRLRKIVPWIPRIAADGSRQSTASTIRPASSSSRALPCHRSKMGRKFGCSLCMRWCMCGSEIKCIDKYRRFGGYRVGTGRGDACMWTGRREDIWSQGTVPTWKACWRRRSLRSSEHPPPPYLVGEPV
jgi:hypothetical protein